MRSRARVDANHAAVVAELRAVGAEVQSLASVGDGCPDLAVGFRGFNFLLEVKDGQKPPSERRLTPKQREWHARWPGQKAVVDTPERALRAIGAIR